MLGCTHTASVNTVTVSKQHRRARTRTHSLCHVCSLLLLLVCTTRHHTIQSTFR
jgi:hypothetical protein